MKSLFMQPQTEKYADAHIAALNRREYIAATKKVFRIFQSWAKKQKSLLKTENSSATIQTVDSLLLQSVSTSCHRKGKRQNA